MPRTREYQNNAERQEAYRARHRDRESPRQGQLAAQARTLHAELRAAVRLGRSPWPAELLGGREDETMHNLIVYLRAHAEREAPTSSKEGSLPVQENR
jgi:hypothetical protein